VNDDPRSEEQSRKFHAMLLDISKQVKWAGLHLDKEEWKKLVIGAAYGQLVVPNPFGVGVVVLNKLRSRDMPKPKMNDLINELMAFGDENGVKWTDPQILSQMEST
jgi:hypothetical protein